MTSWKPIESAPKDGTPFLTFSEDAYSRFPKMVSPDGEPRPAMLVMAFGHYSHIFPEIYTEEGDWHISDYEPTHWMPLPSPPTE